MKKVKWMGLVTDYWVVGRDWILITGWVEGTDYWVVGRDWILITGWVEGTGY
jgi:hypothetical protein